MRFEKTDAGSDETVYVGRAHGGQPRRVTKNTPSCYHGWSPDGKWLVYAAFRGTPSNLDLYRVSVDEGEEQRLTTSASADDGPDYTADGKWMYWNSDRTGNYDIWRMPAQAAGTEVEAEQVTRDEMEDWFPHPSPDGKWLVFLSFEKGPKGHPPNKDVVLRLIPIPGKTLVPTKRGRRFARFRHLVLRQHHEPPSFLVFPAGWTARFPSPELPLLMRLWVSY